jgi:16S rRNA (cytidine1402-2'-O)-methyltransferase
MNTKGTLYIVATPIGNLDDITLRAIETLKNVDLVACEDTRVSRVLLDHFGIKKELISLHQHSDDRKLQEIINRLDQGQNIAYISDGGTPGISDPGQALIAQIRNPKSEIRNNIKIQNPNIQIIPIPGASAVTGTVSVSGLVEKEFYFAGFLPKKKGRQTKFIEFAKLEAPIVIYESALRLERTLKDIEKYFGEDTEVFIAREMTKMFEEYWGGRVSDIIKTLGEHKLKGEVTLIVKHDQKSKIQISNAK